MSDFAGVCQQAAKIGGQVLLEMRSSFTAREKAPADLVTEADVASQEAIRELLLGTYPNHSFVGEEDAAGSRHALHDAEYTWVVDPLDGTTNYVHGLENFCVSVALQRGAEILVGAVYDPIRDRCFHATLGDGAYCNELPISVSDVDALDRALVAASFPPRVQRESSEVRRFLDVLVRCQALRRLGSAALNLCFVANGSLDAYWATSVRKWDVAAGLLIVREAGGLVSRLDGGQLDLENPRFIAASRAGLHQQLVPILSREFAPPA